MDIPKIPDNSMRPQLEELVSIVNKIKAEVEEDDWFSLVFYFEEPASEEDITAMETALGTTLPTGYKDFLRFSNGAQLCGHTAEFENAHRVSNQDDMAEGFPKDYIVLARLIGDGEILCWSKDTDRFVRYYDGREIFFDDFHEFFKWLLEFIKQEASEYVDF